MHKWVDLFAIRQVSKNCFVRLVLHIYSVLWPPLLAHRSAIVANCHFKYPIWRLIQTNRYQPISPRGHVTCFSIPHTHTHTLWPERRTKPKDFNSIGTSHQKKHLSLGRGLESFVSVRGILRKILWRLNYF